MSTTVRINGETAATLTDLAAKAGTTKQAVLEFAVERLRRAQVIQETNDAYRAILDDPEQREDFLAELAFWDQAASDGLQT